MSPDNLTAYVGANGGVSIVNLGTGKTTEVIGCSGGWKDFAISPDGASLFLAVTAAAAVPADPIAGVSAICGPNAICSFSLTPFAKKAQLALRANSLAVSRDETTIYAPAFGSVTVNVIDAASLKVTTHIGLPAGFFPAYVVPNPAGNSALIMAESNTGDYPSLPTF